MSLSQQDASFANMFHKFQPTQMNNPPSTFTSYHHTKLGDVMNEMDALLARRRYELRHDMSLQMKRVLSELQEMYEEIEEMVNSKEIPDPAIILARQLQLNDIENHAVQGIYGVQGMIAPLTGKELSHHSIMEVIPPGQATARDLLERCHQLVTRLLDRVKGSKLQFNQHSYDNKKLGDLLEDLDKRFSTPSKSAKTKVHELQTQLHQLFQDLKNMSQFKPDFDLLTQKQQLLNELENQAVFGVYGIQAQISPLHEVGNKAHHVRMETIPEGQASVRGLIERCHQLMTRLMDRIEQTEQMKAKSCSCSH